MCSTNGCFRSIHNCRWMLSCLKLHCRSCSYWDALGEQQNFLEGVRRLFSLPRAKDYNQELAFENFSQFSWWNMSQQIGVSVPDSETLSSDKSKRFTVGLISQYFLFLLAPFHLSLLTSLFFTGIRSVSLQPKSTIILLCSNYFQLRMESLMVMSVQNFRRPHVFPNCFKFSLQ